MKRYAFVFFSSIALHCHSQDIISRHVDSDIQAKVISINETSVVYSYPGETVTNSIGKAAVSRIKFESGRVQEISPRVDFNGKDDWEKVIITSNPNDVVGLRRRGEIKSKSGGYGTWRTSKGNDRKATEKLKREAAKMGGHVILFLATTNKGSAWSGDQQSIQSGVAYGY